MKRLINTYKSKLKKLHKARTELEEARIAMQLGCSHENVAEVDYIPDRWGHRHTPPKRICVDCGFAEYGWNCGNKILKNPNVIVDSPEALQIGKAWRNHVFVVSTPWKETGKSPKNKKEAYEMAVRDSFPLEYLDDEYE